MKNTLFVYLIIVCHIRFNFFEIKSSSLKLHLSLGLLYRFLTLFISISVINNQFLHFNNQFMNIISFQIFKFDIGACLSQYQILAEDYFQGSSLSQLSLLSLPCMDLLIRFSQVWRSHMIMSTKNSSVIIGLKKNQSLIKFILYF